MPKWWPGNKSREGEGERQKQVYDIVKLYGPMSTNEAAEKLYEERDKPAGIPYEGKAKYSIRAQTKWTLRRLAGLDRVHDINRGAEGTKPQWAVKLPEKHEPKVVTEQGKAKQAKQVRRQRGGMGVVSPAQNVDEPSAKDQRQADEDKKAAEKRRREENYYTLAGKSPEQSKGNEPDSGGLGLAKPASKPSAPSAPSAPSGGDKGIGLGTPAGEPKGGSSKPDNGPRDGKLW